jgi:hypothetical protein
MTRVARIIGCSSLVAFALGMIVNHSAPILIGSIGIVAAGLLERDPVAQVKPTNALPRDFAQQSTTLGDPHQPPYALAQAEMFQHARDIRHVQRHWRGEP